MSLSTTLHEIAKVHLIYPTVSNYDTQGTGPHQNVRNDSNPNDRNRCSHDEPKRLEIEAHPIAVGNHLQDPLSVSISPWLLAYPCSLWGFPHAVLLMRPTAEVIHIGVAGTQPKGMQLVGPA